MNTILATKLYGKEKLATENIENFSCLHDEVEIKIEYCGVCPWDVRAYYGLGNIDNFPIFIGHEFSGIVTRIGENVKEIMIGNHVVADPIYMCGSCNACRTGFENRCVNKSNGMKGGGFSNKVVVKESQVYKISNSLDLLSASFAEPIACVLRSISKANLKIGDFATVIGVGPIGQLHIKILKKMGMKIIAVDLNNERLEKAKESGANITINPKEIDEILPLLKKVTNNRFSKAVFVCVGNKNAIENTMQYIGKASNIILFGAIFPLQSIAFDPNKIHYSEPTITGTSNYNRQQFQQAVDILNSDEIEVKSLVSDIFSLEGGVEKAIIKASKQEGMKVVVKTS